MFKLQMLNHRNEWRDLTGEYSGRLITFATEVEAKRYAANPPGRWRKQPSLRVMPS